MAHPGGVEPPTSRLTVERSNQTELWVNMMSLKTSQVYIPPEGLEPSIFRLEVYCAIQLRQGGELPTNYLIDNDYKFSYFYKIKFF